VALVLANRVQETATPNTTVSFTLTGAVAGFQSFAVIGNTNTTYYSATDGAGDWEVGLGTYSTTGPTLTRTTIYASSNTGSAVTFSGAVNVFVTYPSGKSVNLDGSGNVSALGTVSSGTWQGTTVGVAYGGTGVTTSSGPNSVVLRDANENITVNRLSQGLQTITASGGVTILTAASDFNQQLVGTGGHTFRLPDATTLTDTTTFQFNNNATGTLTIQNNAATTVGAVAPGGAAGIALMNNSTSGGTWDVHGYIPENVIWGTNSLYLASDVITGGIWQGGTIQSAYGGTGLTTFTGANNALYSTSASNLVAGTLPAAAGGTGLTSFTANGVVYANATNTLTTGSALAFDGDSFVVGGIGNFGRINAQRFASSPQATITIGDNTTLSNDVGIYFRQTSGVSGFSTAGSAFAWYNGGPGASEQMRLTSTGLGIGTSSPIYKLHVVGTGNALGVDSYSDNALTPALVTRKARGTSTAPTAVTTGDILTAIIGAGYNSAGAFSNNVVAITGRAAESFTGTAAGTYITFDVAAIGAATRAEAMRLDSSGNLGIGTTNPLQKLVVSNAGAQGLEISPDAVASAPALIAYNRSGGAYVQLSSLALQHIWQSGSSPSERMRLDSSGNLGIGTSSPGDKLTVASGRIRLDQDFQIVWQNAGTNRARLYGDSGSNLIFETGSSNTEQMRLTSSLLSVVPGATIQGITVGRGAGAVSSNTAVGASALAVNTSGTWNTAVGSSALTSISTTSQNTAVGGQAGVFALGTSNTWIGAFTGTNVTGSANTAVGVSSMYGVFIQGSTAQGNSAIGFESLYAISSGAFNTAVGYQAGYSNTTGANNNAVGYQSLYSNTTGTGNVAFGYQTLNSSTVTSSNSAFGYQSMYHMRGTSNTAVGYQAMYASSTPANNTAIDCVAVGQSALGSLTSGGNNTVVGNYAAFGITTGTGNVAVGFSSLQGTSSGSDNVAIGYYAFQQPSNSSISSNVAIGAYAGRFLGTGSSVCIGANAGAYGGFYQNNVVTAIGFEASRYNYGVGNTAVGYRANYSAATNNTAAYITAVGMQSAFSCRASNTTAIGYNSLYSVSTGTNNTAVGAFCANGITTGIDNTAVGNSALNSNTTQSNQTAVGSLAMYYMQGGSNTATGRDAMYGSLTPANNTGFENVANGYRALYSLTSGSSNVGVGALALYLNTSGGVNVAVGYQSLYSNTTSSENTAVGYQAAYFNTAQGNTCFGYRAGYNYTSGAFNTYIGRFAAGNISGATGQFNTGLGNRALQTISSGSNNVAVGASTLQSLTTGGNNTAIGSNALFAVTTPSNNVAVGYNAGYSTSGNVTTNAITTGAQNIYIGNFAYPSAATVTYEYVIGYGSTGKGANTGFINPNGGGVYQGNNLTTWSTTSDARIKQNFIAVENGLEVINALEPFEFDYILTGKHDVGFKAQDYAKVLPSQVSKHAASAEEKELVGEDEIYGIQRNLDPYLVSAIKALTAQVKQLQQEIAQLKGA
jgi:hypothetical protein